MSDSYGNDWRQLLRQIIAVLILVQLVWLLWPHVSSGHPSSRVGEAVQAHLTDPPAVQDAAIAEARRIDQHWALVKIALIVSLDIVAIYFYFRYGKRSRVA
jgi:hypothetical protein